MVNVLIVEDDILQVENLARMIYEIDRDVKIYKADTMEKALNIADRVNIDLFYIDIGLKDSSGLDLAMKIREKKQYRFSWIIFITTHVQYIVQAFKDTHCYDYILKPYDKEKVMKITREIITNSYQNKKHDICDRKYVIFDLKGISIKVYVEEIIFLEINIRTCSVHSRKGTYEISNLPLKKALELINEDYIVQCHRAYAINIHYLEKVEKISPTCWKAYFENYGETALIGYNYKKNIDTLFISKEESL